VRLPAYARRKEALLEKLRAEAARLSNAARFIAEVAADELVIRKRPHADVEAELVARGYDRHGGSYEYLLGRRLDDITKEKVAALLAAKQRAEEQLEELEGTSPRDMWRADLRAFLAAWNEQSAKSSGAPRAAKRQKKNLQ